MGKASSQRSAAGKREPRTTTHESRATSHGSRAASHEPRVQGLDRLIHERLRLGIISALAVNDRLTFNELKRAARDDGRQPERARAEARGRGVHRRGQVVRGADAAHRIPPHGRGQTRAGEISRAHGGADQSRSRLTAKRLDAPPPGARRYGRNGTCTTFGVTTPDPFTRIGCTRHFASASTAAG